MYIWDFELAKNLFLIWARLGHHGGYPSNPVLVTELDLSNYKRL